MLDLVKTSLSSSPYPGLRAFRRDESDIFFGREEQTDQLLQRLKRHRFLAVVGPSGCGKSSLVRAGMLAALETGFLVEAGAHWRIAELRPGEQPLARLAAALLSPSALGPERAGDPDAEALLLATLRSGPLGLIEVVRETQLPARANLIVLVDQFEEIFRFRDLGNIDKADAFVSLLLASVQQIEVPIYIVITMRADFLGDCALLAGLPEALNDGQYLTPRLTREQISSAISGPARVFGADIEPPLVNQLLNEMGPNPDQLPLLQHLLMRLWSRSSCQVQLAGDQRSPYDQSLLVGGERLQRPSMITLQDYREVGTLSQALSLHADEVFIRLNEEQQLIAEVLFKRLTERGLGKRDTRRPSRLGEIAAVAGPPVDEVAAVVEEFRRSERSFIMPPSRIPLTPDSVLDIGHESLIRTWHRLNEWVDEEARSAAGYRRLKDAALLWKAGDADLLGGINLERALAWKLQQEPTSAWASRYGSEEQFEAAIEFLDGSEKQWLEERRQAEVAAQVERRRARLLYIVPIAVLLAAVMTILTVDAYRQRSKATQSAETSAKINLSRKLAAQAVSQSKEGRLDLGLLLSAKAADAYDTFEARSSLFSLVHASPTDFFFGHEEAVNGVVFSADGKTLASCSDDKTMRLWDLKTRQQKGDPIKGHTNSVLCVALNKDATLLASGSSDNSIRIWDMARGAHLGELKGHNKYVLTIAFSPDGKLLASGGKDNTVELWDVASGQLIRRLTGHKDFVYSVAFSPDNHLLASAGKDKSILIWDVSTGRQVGQPIVGHTSTVNTVAFSPDGSVLASGGNDNSVRLWDLKTRKERRSLADHTAAVRSIAFSPDGKLLASGSDDKTTRLYDLPAGTKHGQPLAGHYDYVLSVAFSPDSTRLANASKDKTIQVYDLRTEEVLGEQLARTEKGKLFGAHESAVNSAAFSPDDRFLVTSSEDKAVRLWDVASRKLVTELPGMKHSVWSVAFSPNGKYLAMANYDSTIQLWDTTSWQPIGSPLIGHEGIVTGVAFSPDSETLASSSFDKTVCLWHVINGVQLAQLDGHEDKVRCVAFSPNGGLLASGGDDKTVRIWDVGSRQLLGPLSKQASLIRSVSFSPDGTILAVGCVDDSAIRLFSAESHEFRGVLQRSGESAASEIAFSPDGKMLIVGLTLWAFTDRQLLGKLGLLDYFVVRTAAFSPNGKLLALGAQDGSVRLIDVDIESWKSRARSIANRTFTSLEEAEFLEPLASEQK